MLKEWFSNHRKSKLQSRSNGLFQVLERINDNAYKVDLFGEYSVNATVNVVNLILFNTCFLFEIELLWGDKWWCGLTHEHQGLITCPK